MYWIFAFLIHTSILGTEELNALGRQGLCINRAFFSFNLNKEYIFKSHNVFNTCANII